MSGLQLSAAARVQAFNETIYLLDATELHVIDLSGAQPTARSVPLADARLKDATTIQFWPTNGTVVTVLPDREVVQIDVNTGMWIPAPHRSILLLLPDLFSCSRVLSSGASSTILTLPVGNDGLIQVSSRTLSAALFLIDNLHLLQRSTSFYDMYFLGSDSQVYIINLSAKKLEGTALWPVIVLAQLLVKTAHSPCLLFGEPRVRFPRGPFSTSSEKPQTRRNGLAIPWAV